MKLNLCNLVKILLRHNIYIYILFLFSVNILGQNVNLDVGIEKNWPAPSINKPLYLVPTIDPTYGSKITRIVGNPGDTIPNISGEVWADSVLRHGYSKRQPWNSDMSMIYLNKHSPNLWLDGETYAVLFTRTKPASRVRWSHNEPNIMYYVESDSTGLIGKWDVVEDTISVLVDFNGYMSCSFGAGEGNFTNDNQKVAILGTRKSDGMKVIFVVDIVNKTKGADIEFPSNVKITNCTISQLGNYIIVGGNFGHNTGIKLNANDRFQIYDASTGDFLWEETGYGMPSHFDTQIYQDSIEVIAGVAKSAPYNGWVVMRNLSTKDTTLISVYPNTETTNNSFADHTSGRALNRSGWVFVTHQTNTENRAPYINELVAVKLDGSRVERIAHMHQHKISGSKSDRTEAQAVPSPDGLRVIWASEWDNLDYPVQAYVADYRDKVFSNNKYTLNSNNIGTGTGSLSLFPNAQSFDDGSLVTITAVPDQGSEFAGWSGDLSGFDNPATITMDGNKNIKAIFKSIITVTGSVNTAKDDAEERSDGNVNTGSNDLELVNDGTNNDQVVGIRFSDLSIPQGAEILNAYIEFTATGNSFGASLNIKAENVDSSLTFQEINNNISNRDTTNSIIVWNTTKWIEGEKWSTPNLRSIIQEVVNRNGWKNGNALAIIISGSGKSRAYSFDGTGTAPKIIVKYALPNYTLTTNVNGSGSISLSPSGGIYLEGTNVSLTAIPESGYKFDGWNGDITGVTNPVSITMDTSKNVTASFSSLSGEVDISISSSSDDAEEYENGSTKLTSPDLELVNDGVNNDQTVGMRFTNINIPQGAIITTASIKFTAKDNTGSSTSLIIKGEDVNNSLTFTASDYNITNRLTTSASISWNPNAWTSGYVEQSPELNSIIQEIVNRSGWQSGNAISILVSGSGKRRSWSYDGTGTPPELHIEYSLDYTSLSLQVSNSNDDAEEYSNGATKLSSPDLELVNDGANNDQTVGIRFNGLNIPQGATILSAYLEFTSVDNTTQNTSLLIKTEDVDNSSQFTASTNNITMRKTSNSSVSWEPYAWVTESKEQTPELKTIVQEVVSRTGWISGNPLTFIITGSGKRRAWSYNGNGTPPKLYVAYKTGDINLVAQINSSNNDAEEYSNGTVRLTSSDLELVNNGSGNDQVVGMRFTDISIPRNATILDAFLEFIAKDKTNGNVALTLKVENTDNSSAFTSTAFDLSNRSTTNISVSWVPNDWNTDGVYQSANIKTLVQDIVNRNGWQNGNSLSIIVTGTGKRRAWSYDGNGNAPKLYVKYTGGLSKELFGSSNELPDSYSIANYPNPFNPSTNIVFTLPKPGEVSVTVYDILGRQISEIVNKFYKAGTHKVKWFAQGSNGNQLSSGIYIVRIEAGTFSKSIKLMLLR